MNIQRFTAPTSREALAKARLAFGEGTLILSNRPTENGVEVVATAEDTLEQLDQDAGSRQHNGANSGKTAVFGGNRKEPSYQEVASQVEEDANQLSMSTLSFQDYVRERMVRRRQESQGESGLIRIPQVPKNTPVERPAQAPMERKPSQTAQAQRGPERGGTGDCYPSPGDRQIANCFAGHGHRYRARTACDEGSH